MFPGPVTVPPTHIRKASPLRFRGEETPPAPKPPEQKSEGPQTEIAKADAPKAEALKPEVAKAESPKAEAPKPGTVKAEAPKAEEPKADKRKAPPVVRPNPYGHLSFSKKSLFYAAKYGPAWLVSYLLKQKVNPNLRDSVYGQTPLMAAAKIGSVKKLKALIEAGAPMNVQSNYGETALSLAIVGGHINVVKALLDLGVSPHLSVNGKDSPLKTAISASQPEIVKELLKRGVDVNAKDASGGYPIGTVVYSLVGRTSPQQLEILDILIAAGAEASVPISGLPSFQKQIPQYLKDLVVEIPFKPLVERVTEIQKRLAKAKPSIKSSRNGGT